jgi:hypothetical protein
MLVCGRYVDPRRGDAGFSPHRDRQPDDAASSFRADGTPMYSTVWIPFTGAWSTLARVGEKLVRVESLTDCNTRVLPHLRCEVTSSSQGASRLPSRASNAIELRRTPRRCCCLCHDGVTYAVSPVSVRRSCLNLAGL